MKVEFTVERQRGLHQQYGMINQLQPQSPLFSNCNNHYRGPIDF